MTQTLALGLAGAALVPLLLGGLPIAFSLLAASLLYFVLNGADPSIVGSNMFWFLNKSELVAIPFFILAADLLGRSRATDDLVAAADLVFGRLAGGSRWSRWWPPSCSRPSPAPASPPPSPSAG